MQPTVSNDNGDHIEADLDGLRSPGGKPRRSQSAKSSLLLKGHRLRGGAEVIGSARLHLAEHDHAITTDDEIELARGATVVAVEDPITVPLVKGCGCSLAATAQKRSCVHTRTLDKG